MDMYEVQPELEHLFIDKWESESHKCQAEVMSQQTRALPPSNKVVVKYGCRYRKDSSLYRT